MKSHCYFSILADLTPDLSHVDQLSVVLRYLKNGQPTKFFLMFFEMKSHTGKELVNQVLHYNYTKITGHSYDNAANIFWAL